MRLVSDFRIPDHLLAGAFQLVALDDVNVLNARIQAATFLRER